MSSVGRCPPLISDRAWRPAPRSVAPPRAGPRRRESSCRVSASASGMFGVTRNAWRQQLRLHRLPTRLIVDQPVAALGDHHRIDDEERHVEIARPPRRPLRRSRRWRACRSWRRRRRCRRRRLRSARVTRSADTASNSRDAERVLRGDGGDRARAVHAVRGERLEVGLDAGAGAGIAAGDGQRGAHASRR